MHNNDLVRMPPGWGFDEYDWYLGTIPIADALAPSGTEWRTGDDPKWLIHMDRRAWLEWLSEEEKMEERHGSMKWIREKWLRNPTEEPVEVTYENDGRVLSIWDGHHRIAVAVEASLQNIPAYIGIPKT